MLIYGTNSATLAGGGSVVSTATLDPTNKSTNVTLSGGNLVATGIAGSTDRSGRGLTATTSIGAGVKRFWKAVATTFNTQMGLGLCNASFVFNDVTFLGGDANSVCWFGADGSVFLGASGVGNLGIFGQGAVLGIAVNTTSNLMWGSINGVFTGDPVGGTGGINIAPITGPLFPAYDLVNVDVVTFQFAASGGPSGYSTFP